MKLLLPILAIVVVVLLGLHWLPDLVAYKEWLVAAAAAVALVLAGVSLLALRKTSTVRQPAVSPVSAAPPATIPGATEVEGAEAIGLLAALQENGRLVDFVMDDITVYPDAQVGAAARIVHQGCRTVLDQSFAIRPVCESAEGATISVPVSYRGDEYKLSGSLAGSAPFTGTVVHRGWKTLDVNLPRTVLPDGQLPNIAPAEIEVRP